MMKRFLLSVLAVAFISMPAIAQETPAPEALVPAVSEPVPAVPTEAVTAPADAAAGAPATAASATVVADPNAPVDPMAAAAITTPPVDPNAPKGTGVHPNDMSSLVFTYWEHTAIKDARRARGLVRPPTEAELMKDLNAPEEDLSVKPPPEERDISLFFFFKLLF